MMSGGNDMGRAQRRGKAGYYNIWPEDHEPAPRIDWAQPNFAARRELTMIWGDGGVGTTTLLIAATAHWTAGHGIFDLAAPERSLQVLASCPETDFDTMLAPAFLRQGGDKMLATFIHESEARHLLDNGCKQLKERIEETGPDIVWLDPLMSHACEVQWNDPGLSRSKLDQLTQVAREYDVAIIVRDHFNKMAGAMDPTHRASGSAQKVNAPRVNFIAVQLPQDDEKTRHQAVLSLDKHNLPMEFEHSLYQTVLLGPDTDGIGIKVLGRSVQSAADILARQARRQKSALSPTNAVRAVMQAFPGLALTYHQVETLYGDLSPKQIATAVSGLRTKGEAVMLGDSSFRAATPVERTADNVRDLERVRDGAARELRKVPPEILAALHAVEGAEATMQRARALVVRGT
jgi:hypothetical protein